MTHHKLKLDLNNTWTSEELRKTLNREGLTFQDKNPILKNILAKSFQGFGTINNPTNDGTITINYDKKNKISAYEYVDSKIDDTENVETP